jgi:hypothetical protein
MALAGIALARRRIARISTESAARCLRKRFAPAVVVTISAGTLPDANTGKSRSIPPLPLTITFSGGPRLPSALRSRQYSSASSGKMVSAVPDVPTICAQCAGAHDHDVGNGAQRAHHHAILRAGPTDVGAAGVPLRIERFLTPSNVVKIAEYMWMRTRQRHAEAPVQARRVRRQRQHVAALVSKSRERCEAAGPGRGHPLSLYVSDRPILNLEAFARPALPPCVKTDCEPSRIR